MTNTEKLEALKASLRERDSYFAEAARTKETLAEIIPALEIASNCKADDLRATCPGRNLTPDEWAALWMAKAIVERDSSNSAPVQAFTVSGVIVLAGTDAETGKPRLVIETTEEQLLAVPSNMMFKPCHVQFIV